MREEFGEFDKVWSLSLLAAPGNTNFFIYYKIDSTSALIATMSVEIPIRSPSSHHHVLPEFTNIPQELTAHKDDDEAIKVDAINNHF